MADIKTRGKIKWDDNVKVGCVTTQDLENFIQMKFDAIVQMVNDDIDRKGENRPKLQRADIMLVTVNPYKEGVPGKNRVFFPFLLMMPMSVLKNPRKRANNELAMFNPMNIDRGAKIKDPFYKLISSYQYTKKDVDTFFSPEWQHATHIRSNESSKLKFWRDPKIDKFGKGNTEEFVVMLIDPLRLIHNYAENVDASIDDVTNHFKINITDVTQISSSNYKYSIERVLTKRKKKGGNNNNTDRIYYEINQRVRRSTFNNK